jgi:hypothetical protein
MCFRADVGLVLALAACVSCGALKGTTGCLVLGPSQKAKAGSDVATRTPSAGLSIPKAKRVDRGFRELS